jgi:hypothetical protein
MHWFWPPSQYVDADLLRGDHMWILQSLLELKLQLCLKGGQWRQSPAGQNYTPRFEALNLAEPDACIKAPEAKYTRLTDSVAHILSALLTPELYLSLIRGLILLIIQVQVEIIYIW